MKKRFLKRFGIAILSLSLVLADVCIPTFATVVSQNGIDMEVEANTDKPSEETPQLETFILDDIAPVMDESQLDCLIESDIPGKYDPRGLGKFPALRNQGSYQTCWCFSTIAAIEASLIYRGLADNTIDLSERQLNYYTYKKPSTMGDLLGHTVGDYNTANQAHYMMWGSGFYTMMHLASGASVVDESVAPYSAITTPLANTPQDMFGNAKYRLKDARMINIKNNANVVKKEIMENGGVVMAYYSQYSTNYDSVANDSYYCYSSTGTNHLTCIVGWDDDFPKENFARPAPSDGAWLIRNSYGGESNSYAQYGYFWISYSDKSIYDSVYSYIVEPADAYDNIYQYDCNVSNTSRRVHKAANIYTACSPNSNVEQIKAVGIANDQTNINYTVSIYKLNEGQTTDPENGTLLCSQTGNLTYAGFNKIALDNPVEIEKGANFSVVFSFENYPWIYYESQKTSSSVSTYSSQTGEISLYQYSTETWEDMKNESTPGSLRIKAYTSDVIPVPLQAISLNKASLSLEKGKTETLTVSYTPNDTTDSKDVEWKSDNPLVATVSNGVVNAVGKGVTTIRAICNGKIATCQVTVTEKETPSNPPEEPQNEKQVKDFVSRMYTEALGRSAEEAGLKDWSSQLINHTNDGAGLARGFICSTEFKNKNLSNEAYVNTLYKTFFDREPDAGGKANWMNLLNAGKSRELVLAGFVNSKEFANLCDKYGIARGTMEADGSNIYNAGVRNFVLRMYTKCLTRKGETEGVEDWSHRINKKEMTPETVAKSFFASQEFVEKKLSNEDYVERLYQTFMDRESDPKGKADWVNKLNSGTSRDTVLEGFSRSEEFSKIMKSFGL